MKKLRRSRAAKILSFFLAVIFGALITANIAFAFVLLNNNLYTSDEVSIRNKIFSYLAERTINDVINYFDCRMNYLSAKLLQNGNADYWESEVSLYGSKYAPDNSNVFFSVSDKDGNTVLGNFPTSAESAPECEYVFTRSFTRTLYTDGNGESFVLPNSNAEGDPYTVPDTDYASAEDITIPLMSEAATDLTNSKADGETTSEEHTERMTTAASTLSASGKKRSVTATPLMEKYAEQYTVKAEDSSSFIMLEIEWDDNGSLNGKYLFDGSTGLNGKIYSYCVDDFVLEREAGNTAPLVYFQSDYTVSDSGDVVNAEKETESGIPSGYTSKEENYTVKLYVPRQEDFTAKDIYSFAGNAVSFGVSYRNALIPISIVYLLLLTASVIFLFYSAGYTAKSDAPTAGGIHRIPFDIATVVYLTGLIPCVFLIYDSIKYWSKSTLNTDTVIGLAALYAFCVISLMYIESLAVRIRSRTVFKNTVIGMLIGLIKRTARTAGLAGKTVLLYLLEIVIIALFFIIGAATNHLITAIIGAVILFPLTFALIYEYNVISEGAERFSHGDLNTKITEKLLFGPFKRFAQNLNSINDTVNNAVRDQIKSESMKTELITNVSHDLKTPLTSIVNYIDLLKKLDIDDATAKEYIGVIDRQSQRLKKLTVDIVDASKAATGNIEVNPEKLDLRVMVSQMDGEYCDKLDKSALSLIINVPENPTYVNVDGRLLWRVFDNIMNNVCKYSLPGTRVYLTLTEINGTASVVLRNISKNELNIAPEELTERFVRGDSSRNTEGSGLGLSIASSLTELMGGSFKISIDGDLFKVSVTFPSAE